MYLFIDPPYRFTQSQEVLEQMSKRAVWLRRVRLFTNITLNIRHLRQSDAGLVLEQPGMEIQR